MEDRKFRLIPAKLPGLVIKIHVSPDKRWKTAFSGALYTKLERDYPQGYFDFKISLQHGVWIFNEHEELIFELTIGSQGLIRPHDEEKLVRPLRERVLLPYLLGSIARVIKYYRKANWRRYQLADELYRYDPGGQPPRSLPSQLFRRLDLMELTVLWQTPEFAH